MSRKVYLIFVVVGLILAGILVYLESNLAAKEKLSVAQTNAVAQVRVGKTYGQAKLGGPFNLVDHTGTARSNADYQGKFMVIYFGYSFCPDICPAALINMTQAFNDMSEKEMSNFQPLFITIDPERDTVKNLKLYMENYHDSFVALTGTQEQLDPVIKAYKVVAKKARPDGTSTDYLLDHTSIIYVMDRQGRFVDHFNHQTSPDYIKQRLRLLLK